MLENCDDDSFFETTRAFRSNINICVSYNAFERKGKKKMLNIKKQTTGDNLKMWFDLSKSVNTFAYGGAVAFINHFGDDNRLLPLFSNPIQLKTGEMAFLKLVLNEVKTIQNFKHESLIT